MKVIIRPFNKDIDYGFIISSWPNGAYYSPAKPIVTSKKEFFKSMSDQIDKHIKSSNILIACMEDQPTSLMGFCVIDKGSLEWIYVKELFRRQKIAALLLKNQNVREFNTKNITKLGEKIMKEKLDATRKTEESPDGEPRNASSR